MTLREFFDEYGERDVYFDNYYKYVFTYTDKRKNIIIKVGGMDIYKNSYSRKEKISGFMYDDIISITVNGEDVELED